MPKFEESATRYEVGLDEKAYCSECHGMLDRLAPDWKTDFSMITSKRSLPAFYLCWSCKKIWQTGLSSASISGHEVERLYPGEKSAPRDREETK